MTYSVYVLMLSSTLDYSSSIWG